MWGSLEAGTWVLWFPEEASRLSLFHFLTFCQVP